MEREVGFYWIRNYAGEDWTVGYYDGSPSWPWTILGSDGTFNDKEIAEIGEPIPRPKG